LAGGTTSALEVALDAERRALMHENQARLQRYLDAATPWGERWTAVEREVARLPFREAHRIVVARAEGILPFAP
jgi:hypothetical protein